MCRSLNHNIISFAVNVYYAGSKADARQQLDRQHPSVFAHRPCVSSLSPPTPVIPYGQHLCSVFQRAMPTSCPADCPREDSVRDNSSNCMAASCCSLLFSILNQVTNEMKPTTIDSPTAVTVMRIMTIARVDWCFLELPGIGVGMGTKTLIRFPRGGCVASR